MAPNLHLGAGIFLHFSFYTQADTYDLKNTGDQGKKEDKISVKETEYP